MRSPRKLEAGNAGKPGSPGPGTFASHEEYWRLRLKSLKTRSVRVALPAAGLGGPVSELRSQLEGAWPGRKA